MKPVPDGEVSSGKSHNPGLQNDGIMALGRGGGGTWLQAPAPPDLMLQALQSLPFLAVCDMGDTACLLVAGGLLERG